MKQSYRQMIALLLAAFLAGCATGPKTAVDAPSAARVRVAILAGVGRPGTVFDCARYFCFSPDAKTSFVDCSRMASDPAVLDRTDLLVVPDGDAAEMKRRLGAAGRDLLGRFLRRGGKCLASGGGSALFLEGADGLGFVPYCATRGDAVRGRGSVRRIHSPAYCEIGAFELSRATVFYRSGPVFEPCADDPRLGDFEVMSTFDGEVRTATMDPSIPAMCGRAASVFGRIGEGKIWLFSCVMEVQVRTWPLLCGATRVLFGKEIRGGHVQRREGQLAVGWIGGSDPKADDLNRMVELVENGFDVRELVRGDEDNAFRHVDAIVRCGDPASPTLATLKALAAAPLPPPRAPWIGSRPKGKNAVKAALYIDSGCGGSAVARTIRLVASSPNYEMSFLSGSEIAESNALDSVDLLIVPGGKQVDQANALGEAGKSNLVQWVRSGGAFYGTCAGAYLACHPYLGLIPYAPQESPYRGHSEDLLCRFTPHAKDLWGVEGIFSTLYHGGPVMLRRGNLPDSDIRPIAELCGRNLLSCGTNATPLMSEGPAIVAGRLGKGRVVAVSPHPETRDQSSLVVRAGLRYLTGRALDDELPRRTRGNLSVGFDGNFSDKSTCRRLLKLLARPDFDVMAVGPEDISRGDTDHLDVVILANMPESRLRRYDDYVARGGRLVIVKGDADE